MALLSRQFKQLLLITCLLFCADALLAQQKPARPSREFKSFCKIAGKANVAFLLPDGFQEQPVNDALGYNYGICIPDEDFEVWFKVIPQTEATADSAYIEIGKNEAKALAGDDDFMIRGMSDKVLADYGADAGKAYFLSLPEAATPRHYKYALLITLQKNHKGTVLAVCFTNEKGPAFFKNINRARNSIRFKG